jgi:signal peptidase I
MALALLVYGILANFIFTTKLNFWYLYIINPFFYIVIAIILRALLGTEIRNKNNKIANKSKEYSVMGAMAYIIMSLLLGLIVTFGKNPYSTTLKGFGINLWMTGSVVIAKEYIRYKLINNVYEKEKTKVAIFITIVYVFIDINISRYLYGDITVIYIFKQVFQTLIPAIVKNALFSYIAINADFRASIIYQMGINLYLWSSPILPNLNWMTASILDVSTPIILFMYIQYLKTKNSLYKTREDLIRSDPKNAIPFVITVVLAIWFAVGLFPIKPVAIASGSMEPEIDVGDVAIIKKCNANDISVGDVIEYQMEGYTVVHRVIEKKQKNGEYFFKTKGDNNTTADNDEVNEDQLIGKCIFKVKYLGYPAVWLHIVQANENLEIETGNNN